MFAVESRYVVPPIIVKVSESRTGQDVCILKLATHLVSKGKSQSVVGEGEQVSETICLVARR